jgi:quinol monooxygenase YgiN
MFVRHKAADYAKWKTVYDGLAPVRKQMGVTAASVHRDAKDSNTLIVTHQFKDVNTAMAFASSEELKKAMMNAGVVGAPEFWFTEDVERTPF